MEVHGHAAQRAVIVQAATVMAVLGTAIHVLLSHNKKVVGGPNKYGHDDASFGTVLCA